MQTSIALPITAPDGSTLILGRDAKSAQVVLAHPSVSRAHASIKRIQGCWYIEDLNSTNGTFVSGIRATTHIKLEAGARIDIGAISAVFTGDTLELVSPTSGSALRITGLSYAPPGTQGVALFNHIDLSVAKSSLLCIIGPSGSGKSSLLRAIAGRVRPSTGHVFVDDIDLHAEYPRVKSRVGFVPQFEAVRNELTIREMLYYTSRLRLASDVTEDEIDVGIEAICKRVGLAERLDTLIGALSGGQRRRVGLVNELISRPSLVLLDEVTSGLDEEAAHVIMQLIRELANDGTTILCVTHTVAAIEPYADSVLVLAEGGVPAYFGSTSGLLQRFSISHPGDLYARLRQLPPLSALPSSSALAQEAIDHGAEIKKLVARRSFQQSVSAIVRTSLMMSARYVHVLTSETKAISLALLQGLLIGLALRLVFGAEALPVERALQLSFLVTVSCFWFGCNNAVKEIVKERALVTQEWAAGLSLFAYLFSKVAVLGLLATVQVLLLLATLVIAQVHVAHAGALLGLSLAGSFTGTAIGLLVSARSRTTDAANVALPLLLIPQLLFADALVSPLTASARTLAKISVAAFWLFDGVKSAMGVSHSTMSSAFVVLAAHAGIALIAAYVVLDHSLQAQ
ncbi:MAG: ATP-binding cassette domain-containing protein [Gemmatimonadaceae bacterium]